MKTIKQEIDDSLDFILKESLQLKSRLDTLFEAVKGKSRLYVDKEKIEQLFFQSSDIAREIEAIQRCNKILYENRGRASFKKAISSKENGKKGGRPPKEISDAKKRLEVLDEKFYNCKISKEEKAEMEELQLKILRWKNSKRNKNEE